MNIKRDYMNTINNKDQYRTQTQTEIKEMIR